MVDKDEPAPLRTQRTIEKFRQAEIPGPAFLTTTWFSGQCRLPVGVEKHLSMISALINNDIPNRKRRRDSGTGGTSEGQRGYDLKLQINWVWDPVRDRTRLDQPYKLCWRSLRVLMFLSSNSVHIVLINSLCNQRNYGHLEEGDGAGSLKGTEQLNNGTCI